MKGWNGSTIQTMQMKLQKKRNIRTDFKKKTNERTEEKVETKETLRWQFYAYFVHPFLFDVLFVTLSKVFTFAIFATTVQFTKKKHKRTVKWQECKWFILHSLWHSVAQVKCKSQTNRNDGALQMKMHFMGCHVTYGTFAAFARCAFVEWLGILGEKTTSEKIYRLLSGMTTPLFQTITVFSNRIEQEVNFHFFFSEN